MTEPTPEEKIAVRAFLERMKPFIESLANVEVKFVDETPPGSIPVLLKPIPIPIINPMDPAG